MELKDLMEAFATAFKIVDLKPDDTGIYNVKIDEMKVSFATDPDVPRLVTWGEVGELPPEGREKLFRVLLESMYMGKATGGATFSIEEGTDKLIFHRIDLLDTLDVESFATMLDRFVNILEKWRGILVNFSLVAADQAKAEEQGAQEMREVSFGTFMKV